MKRHFILTLLLCLTLMYPAAYGQMVGDCVFLQANYLEVGISPMGSFGSSQPAPAGYHPNGAFTLWDIGSSSYSSSRLLGFVADPTGLGWTVGSPAYFGDYFLPGTPQEGWSIQANGVQSDAWTQALSFSGPGYTGSLTGTNVSYTNSGGISTGVWQGSTADPLQITQTTMLNVSKYYFTVHVVIKNTGASVANNVYYQRTLDPDNAEEQYGIGDFTTINTIVYQLPDPGNKVMVSAQSPTNAVAWLGLGTKDCRAKCYIIDAGLTPGYTMDQLYSGATPYFYTTGSTYTNDVGIGLVYDLGNINPGDSADLTYAYVMRAADLDSALAQTSPTAIVNSTLLLPGADTINACAMGLDSIPVSIDNGGAYDWVWSPATGLTATTGTSVDVLMGAITGVITYTVIGTPHSSGICANDTFHFTIIPGFSSGPHVTPVRYCQFAAADTLTATGTDLTWYTAATGGTGTHTAPLPSTLVPGTYTWWVTQTLGFCGESVRVPITVTIDRQPHVVAGSNSPVCTNATLVLTASDTVTSLLATYDWTGPLGFTSTQRDPTIVDPSVGATGWYDVTLTVNGCTGTDSTYVVVHQAPGISSVTMTPPSACNVSDGCITLYGLTPDSTYAVFYSFNGGSPVYYYYTANGIGQITFCGLHAGIYSDIFVVSSYACASNTETITLPDGAAPAAPVASGDVVICADSTLHLYATDSATGITYHWTGPNGFSSTDQNPMITGASTLATGMYYVIVTVDATGCSSGDGMVYITVKPTPSMPIVTSNSPLCAGSDLHLHATTTPAGATTFAWTGPDGYTGSGSDPVLSGADTVNTGVYSVVANLDGCPSVPGSASVIVYPIPPAPGTSDISYCQYGDAVALTATGADLKWYPVAYGDTSIPDPIPSTATPGSVTWYATQTVHGCESPRAPIDVTVKIKPVVSITPVRSYICQHDSLTLEFTGLEIPGQSYLWTLPTGTSSLVLTDTMDYIRGRFDSAGNETVTLTVTADGCSTTNSYTVHVVPTPLTTFYVNPNLCVGDTTLLGLTYASIGTNMFTWSADSTHLHIISAGGTPGGPYTVSWDTAGMYIIGLRGYSVQESCPSSMVYDSVYVHPLPDATFTSTGALCMGDTASFTATYPDYSDSYTWAPSSFFFGVPTAPSVSGVIRGAGYVTLTVTDPYGCHATDSLYFDPSSCCGIEFPTGFTPNGDGHNDRFRPITSGHHVLDVFRIVNRWGETVYETATTDDAGWDGTLGGVPQGIGTYYWYIKYTCDGHTIERSGDVTLIR